jgi:hypothetical protein
MYLHGMIRKKSDNVLFEYEYGTISSSNTKRYFELSKASVLRLGLSYFPEINLSVEKAKLPPGAYSATRHEGG